MERLSLGAFDDVSSSPVWHEFTPLAIDTKAVNLGQGFPVCFVNHMRKFNFIHFGVCDDQAMHNTSDDRSCFQDWPCPQFVKDASARAVQGDFNQYCRSGGHLRLVKVRALQSTLRELLAITQSHHTTRR